MKATLSRRSWILVVSLTAAGAAYLTLRLLPEERTIRGLQQQIAAKQNYIDRSNGLRGPMEIARQKLGRARNEIDARRKDWVPSDAQSKIDQLLEDAGVKATQFDPESGEPYENVCESALKIECVGSFAQIYDFLKSVEGLHLAVWVNYLQIENTDGAGGELVSKLELAVFTDNAGNSN